MNINDKERFGEDDETFETWHFRMLGIEPMTDDAMLPAEKAERAKRAKAHLFASRRLIEFILADILPPRGSK